MTAPVESDLTRRAREVIAGFDPNKGDRLAVQGLVAGRWAHAALRTDRWYRDGLALERQTFDLDGLTDLGREVARVIAEGGR